MACWSAENATRAYLQTLKAGNRALEPDTAEFVSAMAAGSCAKLMVDVCAGEAAPGPTTLALVAAARQTGGRVVCILPGAEELRTAAAALQGAEVAGSVELVAGDAGELLSGRYGGADFVLVDCSGERHLRAFRVAQAGAAAGGGGLVIGYNAFRGGEAGWAKGGWRTELLPIGEGLRVSRVPAAAGTGGRKGRRWVVVKTDEFTGEEHVFRVPVPPRSWTEAKN